MTAWIVGSEGPREVSDEEGRAALREDGIALRLVEVLEECSALGGVHLLFEHEGRRVHFGGHGVHFRPQGGRFFAVVDLLDRPRSIEREVWCIPHRRIDATVRVLVHEANDGAPQPARGPT